MQLAALSAGGAAPRGRFNGTVHSVFRQACNIELDDGRLLALLAPDLGNAPHAVRVDAPAGFAFADHVTAGRPVGCRADVLRVAGGEISLDLRTAEVWRGDLPSEGDALTSGEVARAWLAAWRAMGRDRRRLDSRSLESFGGSVDREGVRLARAARDLHAGAAARALDRLIGCGPGLTPSGDDLVVGLLAGLWSTTGRHPARRAFLDALCRGVAAAAAATGDLSRVYLIHATSGRFAEALLTLACRITEGADRGAIERATLSALRVGYTSGRDGTFGLLLGLAAWRRTLFCRSPGQATPWPERARASPAGDRGWPRAADRAVEHAGLARHVIGLRRARFRRQRDANRCSSSTARWPMGPWLSMPRRPRRRRDSQDRMDRTALDGNGQWLMNR